MKKGGVVDVGTNQSREEAPAFWSKKPFHVRHKPLDLDLSLDFFLSGFLDGSC